jgi:hypothetical protein
VFPHELRAGRARRPARHRNALLSQHFPDLASGEWVAAILDWTPEGEPIRTEGGRYRDYMEAREASRAIERARREAQRKESR